MKGNMTPEVNNILREAAHWYAGIVNQPLSFEKSEISSKPSFLGMPLDILTGSSPLSELDSYFDEKNRYDGWSIDFKWKRELLFAHDNWKAKRSCSVVLNDDSFYDAVFELAWENNKHLFPTSSKSEVSLCF